MGLGRWSRSLAQLSRRQNPVGPPISGRVQLETRAGRRDYRASGGQDLTQPWNEGRGRRLVGQVAIPEGAMTSRSSIARRQRAASAGKSIVGNRRATTRLHDTSTTSAKAAAVIERTEARLTGGRACHA
jgi:hypothetical protein